MYYRLHLHSTLIYHHLFAYHVIVGVSVRELEGENEDGERWELAKKSRKPKESESERKKREKYIVDRARERE